MLRAVMCAAGPESMLADATFAVAQETPGSPWRDTALWELGQAHLLLGRVDEARARFAESSTYAATMDNTDSIVSCEVRAGVAGDGARRLGGRRPARRLGALHDRREADARLRPQPAGLRRGGPARPPRRDTDAARRHLERAMRGRLPATFAIPFVSVRLRLQLAKLYLAISEAKTARQLLREIDDILIHRPALGRLVDEVDELRARTADAAAGGTSASPLTPAELRLVPYLQTHLSFREIGERLYVSRHTVKTQAIAVYRKLGVSGRDRGGPACDGDRAPRGVGDVRIPTAVPAPRRCHSRARAPASVPPPRRRADRRPGWRPPARRRSRRPSPPPRRRYRQALPTSRSAWRMLGQTVHPNGAMYSDRHPSYRRAGRTDASEGSGEEVDDVARS